MTSQKFALEGAGDKGRGGAGEKPGGLEVVSLISLHGKASLCPSRNPNAAKVDRVFSPLLKAPEMFCPLGRKTSSMSTLGFGSPTKETSQRLRWEEPGLVTGGQKE